MYRRILVPLDGTRFGDHALPYAVALATRTGATLELAHVHHHHELDPDLAAMPQYRFQHMEEADVRHERDELTSEQRALEQRAADLELRYGIAVSTRVLHGPTAEALWQEARDIVADLVVIATHARHGLARLRFGSVASELIQHLNIPTLCVHPTGDVAPLVAPQIRKVLVPLDGSDFSEQILDVLPPLLRALDAHATLLHVVTATPTMITGINDVPRLLPHREEARVYLNDVAERFAAQLPSVDVVAVENGEPIETIAGMLERGGYDMAAMATHGRSGLSRMLLGSVANDLLPRTATPVLLYRPRLQRLPDTDLRDAFRVYGD